MPAVVSRPRGPSLLVPANAPSTCVSSAAIQRCVSADTGLVVARLPAAAAGASCVVPGALQRCLSAFASVSLLPEPVAPRAAPAAAPGASRAVRRVSTPGPSPVPSMARGPPPPARAPCTRVAGREKRGWPASSPDTAARADSEPTERSAAPRPTTASGRGLQPPPLTPAGRPFSGGPHAGIFCLSFPWIKRR